MQREKGVDVTALMDRKLMLNLLRSKPPQGSLLGRGAPSERRD
jgi:hypothetical protein